MCGGWEGQRVALFLVALLASGCGGKRPHRIAPEPEAVPRELVLIGRTPQALLPLSRRELRHWRQRFRWPVDGGSVSSAFGRRAGRFHDGIDIYAPEGTPVRAAWDGEVLFVGALRGYGETVALRHERGLLSLYAHLQRARVRRGEHVRAGQVIGAVGTTGRTTGPNLHFEIRRAQVALDPYVFLGPRLLAAGSVAWCPTGAGSVADCKAAPRQK